MEFCQSQKKKQVFVVPVSFSFLFFFLPVFFAQGTLKNEVKKTANDGYKEPAYLHVRQAKLQNELGPMASFWRQKVLKWDRLGSHEKMLSYSTQHFTALLIRRFSVKNNDIWAENGRSNNFKTVYAYLIS